MIFNKKDLKNKNKIGIYSIKNTINNKVYIGSTGKSFNSRYNSHFEKLRTNNHKGYSYLQNSVNKYGITNFIFSILEICDKDILVDRETYYINKYDSCNRDLGYNINPNPGKSPIFVKEVKEKISNKMKELYKNGILKPNNSCFKKGIVPWNKGKKYNSTNHLKVEKKIKADRTNANITIRSKLPVIQCFTDKNKLIFQGKSFEIFNESKKENNCFKQYIPNKNKILYKFGITKSVKYNKTYKSLYFKQIP